MIYLGRAKRGATADGYYRMAKELGLKSRAAFKLKQLDDRYRLIRSGDVVVDLGAAPGGWTQIASERVGVSGLVVAVDLQPVRLPPTKNVAIIKGDVRDPSTVEMIRNRLPQKADLVMSDMSPQISGVWDVDHMRSVELSRTALSVAGELLRPGGNFIVKVFQGEFFSEFLKDVKKRFEFVKASKPAASRSGSAEIYIVAMGMRKTENANP
ncbi:MAG: RlmE family RNA methyltransferase [Candidatus Hadarchaeales archaeon]